MKVKSVGDEFPFNIAGRYGTAYYKMADGYPRLSNVKVPLPDACDLQQVNAIGLYYREEIPGINPFQGKLILHKLSGSHSRYSIKATGYPYKENLFLANKSLSTCQNTATFNCLSSSQKAKYLFHPHKQFDIDRGFFDHCNELNGINYDSICTQISNV